MRVLNNEQRIMPFDCKYLKLYMLLEVLVYHQYTEADRTTKLSCTNTHINTHTRTSPTYSHSDRAVVV